MKTLNKEEKEIIKLIQEKKITDIYSYVKYYNLGTEIQYFKEDIQKAFENKYGTTTRIFTKGKNNTICKKYIIEELSDNRYKARPYLTFNDGFTTDWDTIYYKPKGIKHSYHLTEPTYTCDNIDQILNFISIWQFLESDHLIIELPKSCDAKDMGLFLRKTNVTPEDASLPDEPCNTYDLQINAREFMSWEFKLDVHNFEICLPYLMKQIQPTLGLNTFVKNKYRTECTLIERRNFIIALAGVVVAIITSLISLFASIFDNGNAKELNNINNSIQEIHEQMVVPNETDSPIPNQ